MNNMAVMDRMVGPKDNSYKPSAEGEQERGRMTRHDIGKGWGETTRRGKRHVPPGKKGSLPNKVPWVFGCNCPNAMEVWVRPSQTLRNL